MRQQSSTTTPEEGYAGGGSRAGGTGPAGRARSRAFTTIELLAVLVLMAVVAAAAVLSLGASLRVADLDSAIDAVAAQDQSARELARREATPLRLRFGSMGRSVDVVGRGGATRARVWEPPVDFRIDRVLLRGGSRPRDSSGEEIDVAISSKGWSQPYALRVSGGGDRSGWIVFGGFTGRTFRVNDEQHAREQLGFDSDATSAGRNDAR